MFQVNSQSRKNSFVFKSYCVGYEYPTKLKSQPKRTNMKLSLSRYRSVLLVQISLLIVDLLINTFCEYLRFESVILLVVFVIQDVCLVFSLIIVFLSFFSTYIFQAGLVGVLVQQFRTPIFVTVLYIGKFAF